MGRDLTKTTELNLDYAYGILKSCNGNLKWFYEKWVDHAMVSIAEFYTAMKYMEKITPKVEQEIDEAYFQALAYFGMTHEDMAIMPTFEKLFYSLENDLRLAESYEQFKGFKETQLVRLRFYRLVIEANILKIEKPKKAKLV